MTHDEMMALLASEAAWMAENDCTEEDVLVAYAQTPSYVERYADAKNAAAVQAEIEFLRAQAQERS